MAEKITLEDVRRMDCVTITPAVAADVIGCDAHGIRIAARTCPERLGFPVMITGAGKGQVRIPRLPFLQFLEGSTPQQDDKGASA